MKMIKTDGADKEELTAYYFIHRSRGNFRYLMKFTVLSESCQSFEAWLAAVEYVGMDFSFWLTEETGEYMVFFGYADFPIKGNLVSKCLYINTEDDFYVFKEIGKQIKNSIFCYLSEATVSYLREVKAENLKGYRKEE